MDKSNLELFKQAISEGLSQKFDSVVNSYTDEIVCSEKHNIAMRTIVYGKANTRRAWSPKMKRIIAILVAAALLLTSCGIIFRNEIREIIDELFVKYVYSGDENSVDTIEEVYKLGYLPKGYSLKHELIRPIGTQYEFKNENGDFIWFEQRVWDGTDFTINSERGYSKIVEIEYYNVYYRYTETYHCYIWNDGKYSLSLRSNQNLSTEEIELIIREIQ